MPGEQLTTDLGRIDGVNLVFRTASGPDDQTAAFYEMGGLAKEFAGSADAARTDADEALGMAAQAEQDRDAALEMVGESAPHDESEEFATLREKVAALTGELATAQAETAAEKKARRLLEEQLAVEVAAREREKRASNRRIAKVQGALAVTKTHVCRPEDVPRMAPAGVVQGLRIWAQNSVPGQQWVILITEQDRSGEEVTITARRGMRMSDDEYSEGPFVQVEHAVIDGIPTERATLGGTEVDPAPGETSESQ
jgi:hypothetical protein